ncbi:metallophosphoesterase family protein [Pseudooceanicola sp. LIPI14-2-Ac024]|uniref:metallophosphoesterase family protein n=1 Tax=Pseudooceanicola sp. LIPI14-2-Ac024 TaxID=3344875 RepID=UPI0035D12CB9
MTSIPALLPQGAGHHFVFYGDACSGVPGAPHEALFARVNAVVRRLDPDPEFIVFPGDEIIGLTPDPDTLRAQWRHWFEVEMGWLDRARVPLYHATGNHTVFDAGSEAVFAEVMAHLPRNGPPGQAGLSYVVRRGDLALVFVNTLWSGLGGEGHIELDWLDRVLAEHADAHWRLVVGHHPAWPVNGYVGSYQRCIGDGYVAPFWELLVRHGVTAYLCSHILAFDVQCHRGVLQITSAGAGTAHRMPEGVEYLHCVQMALDAGGLRYRVLDDSGVVREALSWPPGAMPEAAALGPGLQARAWPAAPRRLLLRLSGTPGDAPRRVLLMAAPDSGPSPVRLEIVGPDGQLTAVLEPQPGRSPHRWFGPKLAGRDAFDIEVLLHAGMGPGGLLWRAHGADGWTGFHGVSAWGPERIAWPERIRVGDAEATEALHVRAAYAMTD